MTRLLAGREGSPAAAVRAGAPGLTGWRIVGISLGFCLIMKLDGFDSEAG
jgi:hypothetical protein